MTRRRIMAFLAGILPTMTACKNIAPSVLAAYPPYPEKLVNGVLTTDQYDVERWEVAMRRKLADSTPRIGFGACDSCNMPWWAVQGHTVSYERGRGCFYRLRNVLEESQSRRDYALLREMDARNLSR